MRHPSVHATLSLGNAGLRRARGAARRANPRHRRVAGANPRHPTLGIAVMAQDCAARLPVALSTGLLAVADDVVVLDGGSRDDTVTVAGATMVGALEDLIRNRRNSGWWLPRRWVVPTGEGLAFLAGRPHWPDLQGRLARVTADLRYSGAAHSSVSSTTAGPWGIAPPAAAILHLDLALDDRAAREAKVAARSDIPGFAGTEGFYLWEDHVRRIGPLPRADQAIARSALAAIRAGGRPAG